MANLIDPFVSVRQVDIESEDDMVELFLGNGHVVTVYGDGRIDIQEHEGYTPDEEIVHMYTEEMFMKI